MKESIQFTVVLRNWAEVFMRRSMHDFIQFTRSTGLTMGQISTLMRIAHHGACGVSDIGDYLGVTNAASSQMIHKMVEQDLLERTEDPKDRRNKLITLAPKGQTLVKDFIESRYLWVQDLTTQLTQEEQETIITALTALTDASQRLDPVGESSLHQYPAAAADAAQA
jgi:DNA-binding MarR family transcriptional regulator